MKTNSPNKKVRKSTETASFGTPGRINHDSSKFYKGKLYEGLIKKESVKYIENALDNSKRNKIFIKSSENMLELPDHSVHLMVTSPPYNVGKDYDDNLTLNEYREFLKRVFKETYRVLVPGGRACINIANLGRKPYLPLHSFIIEDMLELGFLMRGEIIWDKGSSASPSTAWGTWLKANNPVLRDVHEYILVFSKETFTLRNPEKRKSTITKEEFLELTKSVWKFPAAQARKIGHPAPFPDALPYKLIQLYTFEKEIILDPFMGSGQTAIAALKSRRFFVGYEIEDEYVKLSEKRIKEYLSTLSVSDPFI